MNAEFSMGNAYTVHTLYSHSLYLLIIKFDKYSITICIKGKCYKGVKIKVDDRQFSNYNIILNHF